MKKALAAGVVLFVIGFGWGVQDASASSKQLLGKWLVLEVTKNGQTRKAPPSVKIYLTFKKGGAAVFSIQVRGKAHKKTGTWKLKGGKLVMTLGGDTDTMTYKRKGAYLTLSSTTKSESTRMKKQ